MEQQNSENCSPQSINIDNNGDTKSSTKEDFKFTGLLSLEDLRSKQIHFIKERNWEQFHPPRNVLIAMVGEVGELAEIFQWKGEVTEGLPEFSEAERKHVGEELSDVLLYLLDLSHQCKIDLPYHVQKKIFSDKVKRLNPHNSENLDNSSEQPLKDDAPFSFSSSSTFEDLRKKWIELIKNGTQVRSPRNILLALVCEVGKLSEIFQWKGEVSHGLPELTGKECDTVADKISHVLLYLLELSYRCHIDLPTVAQDKMTANAQKYSVEKSYGKANKYTDYQ